MIIKRYSDLPQIGFNAPAIYFMHVPKTAGKALCRALSSLYSARDVLSLHTKDQLRRVSLEGLSQYRCYLCHFGPGMYELVGRPDLPCITVLRHPVEQTISQIYFTQRQVKKFPEHFKPEYLNRWAPLHKADLRTLLNSKIVQEKAFNGQTRLLGIKSDFRPFLSDGAIGSLGISWQGPLKTETTEQTMPEIAASAHRQLENMALIGITERFAETFALLSDLIGSPLPSHLLNVNIGPKKQYAALYGYRDTIAPDLIAQVEALTVYDHELYAHACELFDRQWSRYLAKPQRTYNIAPRLRMIFVEPLRTGWRRCSHRWPAIKKNRLLNHAKNIIKQVV